MHATAQMRNTYGNAIPMTSVMTHTEFYGFEFQPGGIGDENKVLPP